MYMSSFRYAWLATVCVALGTLPTGSVLAQDRSQPETRVDDVIVTGRPLDVQVDRFVDTVTAPPPGRGPARWSERSGICVGVVNLAPALAQNIADRVSDIADSMGVPVGEPGCRSNRDRDGRSARDGDRTGPAQSERLSAPL